MPTAPSYPTIKAFGEWKRSSQPELHRAQERIGDKPADTVKWLLDRFHERELSALSVGARLDLRWETWVFLHGLNPTWEAVAGMPFPDETDLQQMQDAVAQVVRASFSTDAEDAVDWPCPSFRDTFQRLPGYGPIRVKQYGAAIELYRSRILDALAPAAKTFARCKECNRVFPKRQEDQVFCSFKCQDRMAKRMKRRTQQTKGRKSVRGVAARHA